MRAVFLDRDGVIDELIYHEEQGIIDSPFTPQQLRLFPWVGEAINRFRDMGYKVVLVSNQPGIAKGHFSWQTFERIREKMRQELETQGAFLDGEYYCLHHPEAKIESLKVKCGCRKPKPGLLFRAAWDLGIDLPRSWMIGDGLVDIGAGKNAGCGTVLVGTMKCELCRLLDEEDIRPDLIVTNVLEAAEIIQQKEAAWISL
jgi:D-glycero-D-manno-heptose 1,7-bisphosphate phosphatase